MTEVIDTQTDGRKYQQLAEVLLHAIGSSCSQRAIAEAIFVSQEAVHAWMTGKSRPRPAHLGFLAAVLQLEPSTLATLACYDDVTAQDKVMSAYRHWCAHPVAVFEPCVK
jgi:hypothetical protein